MSISVKKQYSILNLLKSDFESKLCFTIIHYNAVVGVHREKTRYNGPRYVHATVQNL